jgi:hypothetical protein
MHAVAAHLTVHELPGSLTLIAVGALIALHLAGHRRGEPAYETAVVAVLAGAATTALTQPAGTQKPLWGIAAAALLILILFDIVRAIAGRLIQRVRDI